MKNRGIYLVESLLFISIIIFNIIYQNYYLQALAIGLLGFYCIHQYGIMKDNNYLKNSTIKIVTSCLLAYFIIIYILGLFVGFHKTIMSFHMSYFINVITVETIIIIMEEIIRYIICRNTQHQKMPIIFYTMIISILNIILEINGYNLHDQETLFVFITTVIIPVVCREAIASYLTYKVSYKPSMVFKLSMSLYELLLPIIPSLGNYIYAVSNVTLPYMIYFFVSKIMHYKDKEKYELQTLRRIAYIPIIVCLLVLVVLISGIYTNTLIAIGSNSMVPSFARGDGVIYTKTKTQEIKVGEVIAFKNKERVITHRVMAIQKKNNKIYFKTKGDANNAPDAYETLEDDVLGVVKCSIKFIGYPTLWFNDLIKGKETSS